MRGELRVAEAAWSAPQKDSIIVRSAVKLFTWETLNVPRSVRNLQTILMTLELDPLDPFDVAQGKTFARGRACDQSALLNVGH
jgi:hypothetical protein